MHKQYILLNFLWPVMICPDRNFYYIHGNLQIEYVQTFSSSGIYMNNSQSVLQAVIEKKLRNKKFTTIHNT